MSKVNYKPHVATSPATVPFRCVLCGKENLHPIHLPNIHRSVDLSQDEINALRVELRIPKMKRHEAL